MEKVMESHGISKPQERTNPDLALFLYMRSNLFNIGFACFFADSAARSGVSQV